MDEVFPISARDGTGLDPLVERLTELIPEGPFMYPPEQSSDQASEVLLAELVREQVLRRTRDELPHAVEVEVTDVERRDDGVTEVHAQVWAETESQKGILIGKGGSKIKEIGTGARRELETRARRPGLPRPQGPRPRQVAPRRGASGPHRHRVAPREGKYNPQCYSLDYSKRYPSSDASR